MPPIGVRAEERKTTGSVAVMAGDSDSEREIGGLVSPNAAPAKGGAASPSLLMRRCADPIGSPRVSEGRERNTCLARLGVGRTMWAKEKSNDDTTRWEEHTSELQSLMSISNAVES